MEVQVIFAQRKCSYPGEYGMEALNCATEYELGDNPDVLVDNAKDFEESDEFESIKIVKLQVSESLVKGILFPKNDPIPTTIDL